VAALEPGKHQSPCCGRVLYVGGYFSHRDFCIWNNGTRFVRKGSCDRAALTLGEQACGEEEEPNRQAESSESNLYPALIFMLASYACSFLAV